MSIASTYLVKYSNAPEFFEAIRAAQAPERFTLKFINDLGFTSTNDRLYLRIMKALGFVDDNGVPTKRYFRYLDPAQSDQELGAGIHDAYEELFALNREAYTMDEGAIKGKLKTITQGAVKDDLIKRIAKTFRTLCDLVDWSKYKQAQLESHYANSPAANVTLREPNDSHAANTPNPSKKQPKAPGMPPAQSRTTGDLSLQYNIEIHLPPTRDQAVYDAIFSSLRKHLLRNE